MSTRFTGEGNIGSPPEYREFQGDNGELRRMLRLNVYFDNPVPGRDGYEDRGGLWMPVEIWNKECANWSTLYQKGMRVLVEGRQIREEWTDAANNERVTIKVDARVVGILPYRIATVTLSPKQQEIDGETKPNDAEQPKEPKEPKARKAKA